MKAEYINIHRGFVSPRKSAIQKFQNEVLMRPFASYGRFELMLNGHLKELYGHVEFEPGGGVVLVIYRGKVEALDLLAEGFEIELIKGKLNEGVPCTILECTCYEELSFIGDDVISSLKIYGESLVLGKTFGRRKDLFFDRVLVEFSHMEDWLNSPLSLIRDKHRKYAWNIQYAPSEAGFKFTDGGNAFAVSFQTKASFPVSASGGQLEFTYRHVFEVTSEKRVCLDEFIEKCSLLRGFFAFLLGRGIYTLRLRACKGSYSSDELEVLWPVTIPTLIKFNGPNTLTSFENLEGEIESAARNWMEEYEKLAEIRSFILEVSSKEAASPNSIYLRATQVLEHFHSAVWPDSSKHASNKEWRKKALELEQSLREDFCIGGLDRAKLLSRIGGLNNLSLRSKISNFMKKMPLSERSYLHLMLKELGEEEERFVRRAVSTRNYLTHYSKESGKGVFKGKELEVATKLLFTLLNFWVARFIGFSERISGFIALNASNSMFLVNPERDL